MNRQEQQALQDFLHGLAQARVSSKDLEADAMISDAAARQPDALYLLVQRTLLQDQALDAAQRRIAALQAQLSAQLNAAGPSGNSGFLDPSADWGRSARPASPEPAQRYVPEAYNAPPARTGLMGGGGSFLGSMAAAAAGVAAGSFLFHGIDQLLHPHGQPGSPGNHEAARLSGDRQEPDPLSGNAGTDAGNLASDAGIDDIGGFDDSSA